MRIILLIILFPLTLVLGAQELVPNGSFSKLRSNTLFYFSSNNPYLMCTDWLGGVDSICHEMRIINPDEDCFAVEPVFPVYTRNYSEIYHKNPTYYDGPFMNEFNFNLMDSACAVLNISFPMGCAINSCKVNSSYLSTKLTEPMVQGCYYKLAFQYSYLFFYDSEADSVHTGYISMGASTYWPGSYALNSINRYVNTATKLLSSTDRVVKKNKDTLWHKVELLFKADSNYRFITLGNFDADLNNQSLQQCGAKLDSISVFKIEPSSYVTDTVCAEATLRLQTRTLSPAIWSNALQDSITKASLYTTEPITAPITYYAKSQCYTDTFALSAYPKRNLNITQIDTACFPDGNTQLQATQGFAQYNWGGASSLNNPQITTNKTAIKLDATDTFGCVYADNTVVQYHQLPIAAIEQSAIGCLETNKPSVFSGTDKTLKYFWEGQMLSADSFETTNTGNIACKAINQWGCEKDTILSAKFLCNTENYYIPNAFSPNGDGHNEVYSVVSPVNKTVQLTFYNGYGEKIHEGNSWDGNYKSVPCLDGWYMVIIKELNAKQEVIRTLSQVIYLHR